MGMSASQARLLSITARLTNNEFRAQTITNSKLRLASESEEASRDYMDVLRSKQLMFMNYDDNGDATKLALTHSLMYQYAPLKNQYILRNPNNKLLISNVDAKNFTQTGTLHEFLDCYGLLEGLEYGVKTDYVDNPKYAEWEEEHAKWEEEEPKQEDYTKTERNKIGEKEINKWVHTNSKVYDAIADISCFSLTQGGARCYFHVLSSLLGYGEHTTSSGQKFIVHKTTETVTQPDGEVTSGWCWCTCTPDEEATMTGLREEMKNDPVYDQPYDDDLDTEKHGVVHPGGDGSDAAKYNAGGTIGGNCWQKCIDLLWELHDGYVRGTGTGGTASAEELKKFWYFVELDLGDGHFEKTTEEEYEEVEVPDEEKWQEEHEKWEEREPEEPDKVIQEKTSYISDIIVNDQHKSQWYTNLWHILNGSDTANLVKYKQLKKEDVDDETLYGFKVPEANKTIQCTTFEVLAEELSTSPKWLQFALEQGVVSMEQAIYIDPSEDSLKIAESFSDAYTWKSINYANAKDIVSQDNDVETVKAEAVYKKRIKDFESQNKSFDQDLKKLDTEHSALQTEYESIKEVISKNADRSFKAFS